MDEPDDPFRPRGRFPADEPAPCPPSLAPLALAVGLVLGGLGGYLTPRPAHPARQAAVLPAAPALPPSLPPKPVPPSLAGLVNAGRALRLTLAADYRRVAAAVESGAITTNDELVAWFAASRKPLAAEAARQLDAAVRAGCDRDGLITDRAAVAGAIRVYADAYGGQN